MELATLAGIVVVLGAVFASLIMEGASPTSILLLPPIVLVIVGTLGAAVAGGFMSDVKVVGKQVARAFTAKAPQSDAAVADLVSMADTARREGLLALEERLRGIEDPFLRQGIEMTVDGTDADESPAPRPVPADHSTEPQWQAGVRVLGSPKAISTAPMRPDRLPLLKSLVLARIAVVQTGVEFARSRTQLGRFGAVLVGGGQPIPGLPLSFARLYVRFGSLAVSAHDLLLRYCPFGFRAGVAFAGIDQVVLRLCLVLLGLYSLALRSPFSNTRQNQKREYRQGDNDDDDHDDQSLHGVLLGRTAAISPRFMAAAAEVGFRVRGWCARS